MGRVGHAPPRAASCIKPAQNRVMGPSLPSNRWLPRSRIRRCHDPPHSSSRHRCWPRRLSHGHWRRILRTNRTCHSGRGHRVGGRRCRRPPAQDVGCFLRCMCGLPDMPREHAESVKTWMPRELTVAGVANAAGLTVALLPGGLFSRPVATMDVGIGHARGDMSQNGAAL